MPTDYENLLARKSAIISQLAGMTASSAGGKPNYSIDGQSVDHVGFRKSLYEELESINRLIAAAEGPWEVEQEIIP